MKLPASEQSRSAGPTISSGWAARLMKQAFFMDSTASGGLLRTMSVSTVPGARALTRIPLAAYTAAIDLVIDISPDLAAAYMAVLAEKRNAPAETTLRTAALPDDSKCGKRALDEEHRAPEVRRRHPVPRVHGQVPEGEGQRVGGIVHHDVEPAKGLHRAVDERSARIDVPHVRRHAHGIAAH